MRILKSTLLCSCVTALMLGGNCFAESPADRETPGLQVTEPSTMENLFDKDKERVGENEIRARMREDSEDSAEQNRDLIENVQDSLHQMIALALNVDLEDFVDYLSEPDRERIEGSGDFARLTELSQSFNTSWTQKHGKQFEEGIEEIALPVTVTKVTNDGALATVRVNGKDLPLRLVRSGWLKTSWLVDAPDTLTLRDLEVSTENAIASLGKTGLNLSKVDAYQRAAYDVLLPISVNR